MKIRRQWMAGAFLLATSCMARDRLIVQSDQVYANDGHPKHRADLFQPADANPRAAFVFVHGGFWRNQDRRYWSWLTGLYSNVGRALAARGYASAVISYRLYPEANTDQQLDDLAAAVQWFKNRMDASQPPPPLFVAGHSAGGHLALLLLQKPEALRARGLSPASIRGVVALSPILDVSGMIRSSDSEFNQDLSIPLFGPTESSQRQFSPLSLPVVDLPPVLLVAGEMDFPYINQQCRQFAEILHRQQKRYEHKELPGYEHSDMVLRIGQENDPVVDAIDSFVQSVLAGR